MSTVALSENQKIKILEFLHNDPYVYAGNEAACLLFTEAVLWITRSAAAAAS